MPRRSRFHLDDFPLHIVQRGHNRERCFFDDSDYARYLDWLTLALRQADCRLHAFVLMSNHVHLLLTPARASAVPNVLMSLGRRYVPYVNRRYTRTGTLWESRYRSSLVSSDYYLLACHRYIEMNPVRANLTRSPADYPWSSFRSNAYGEWAPLLTPHPLYIALGQDQFNRQAAYRRLFEVDLDAPTLDEIRHSLKRGDALGGRKR